MKKLFLLIAVLVLCLSFVNVVDAADAKAVYVAPDGSDLGDGSFSHPFATLKKAVEHTRSFSGEKYIFMRGGRYNMSLTVNLTSDDKNLTVCAFNGEKVTVTAAAEIPYSSFGRVTDKNILDRIIEEKGRNAVMQVYLPSVGITSYGQIASYSAPSLTCNKRLLHLAEYPNRKTMDNGGYLYTSNVSGKSFVCDDNRLNRYSAADSPWVLGYFMFDWSEVNTPAVLNGKSVTVSSTGRYGITNNRRLRFFNLLEELDVPSEYYIDRKTGYLYIIPPEDIKKDDVLNLSTQSIRFIYGDKAQNVTFKNLTFEGTLSNAAYFTNSKNIKFDGCEFFGIGSDVIDFNSCYNCGVVNSSIHDVQSRGIYFMNCGDRYNLKSSGCYVENCRFERFSQYLRCYYPGIQLTGCGFLIKNNYFGDCPHFVMRYETNNAVIEYNEFGDVCNDSSDAGALYSGRDWSTLGNVIRYNYFHDMPKIYSTAGYEIQAVYLDDCHASTSVYKNIFYKCHSPALFGGGRYNTFTNNMIFECTKPFVMDARGEKWDPSWASSTNPDSNHVKLKRFNYKSGIWAETYPYIVDIMEDDAQIPKHNTIKNNIEYKSGGFNIHEDVYKYGDVKNNITMSSTVYLNDYAAGDFGIKNLEIIKKRVPEFEDVPFDMMGTYETEKQDDRPKTEIEALGATANPGDVLKLSYSSTVTDGKIADNIIKWYENINGVLVEIPNASKNTLTLDESYAGKTVTASVMAVDSNGNSGYVTWFGNVNVSKIDYSKDISVTKAANTLKICNNTGSTVELTVFGPQYNVVNGYKTMNALEFLSVRAEETKEVDILSENAIVASKKTLEPIVVEK